MKSLLIALLIIVMAAGAAFAQCPDERGQWSTTTGTMVGGRASEAYCGADGEPLVGGRPGNTQNAMSWDGALLGEQWQAYGMEIDANGAVLIGSTVDVNGDGTETYQTFYTGGQFWLSRDYNWADGLADLSGPLTNFQVITTITYVGFAPVGASSNITFGGEFDNCATGNNCAITFGITNALLAWRPDFGVPMPSGYPDFLCGAASGELFDVCCITLQIDCAVGTEEDTNWGSLKAQYR